jgi:PAS domain S-box-containing protein
MDTVFTQGSPEDRFALLDALYAQAPVGLAFLDTQLRYRRVNAALAAINGRTVEEHLGRTLFDVLGEASAPLVAAAQRVVETGEPSGLFEVDTATAADPGRPRSFRVGLYPVAGADGRLRGVGAVVVETSPERRAAAEAEAARAMLDLVFDLAPVGMAFWDTDLRYLRINDAGTELNGLPPEEHLGRRAEEVLTGPFGERIVALLREVLRTGEPVLNVELSGERPGRPGELHHREASYFPLPGAEGAIAGVGAVVHDVTARRRLDELRQGMLAREHEARLAAEAARARAELLAGAGHALAASLDWEETVRCAVAVAVPRVAERAALYLRRPTGRIELAGAEGGEPAADPAADAALRTVRAATLVSPSTIVAAVTAGSRRLGALRLERAQPAYGDDDLVLAEALADRIAVALENARLHTERSRIAETLQQSLLPPVLPVLPGFEVAAAYVPADDAAGVGGDFYDLFESEPGVWTALLGDVAGKGAEAAALTSLARYTLRTASMLDTSPAHNLRLLNEALLSRDAGTCTVVYARMTASAGGARLVAAAAGHPPPLVLRAGGELEELTPPGTLLGAVEAPRLQTREVELGAGDLVLFYTDGATDVRVRGGVLGDGALRGELAACAGCHAQQVVERIAARVRAAQSGRLDDDLALLALRVVPGRR